MTSSQQSGMDPNSKSINKSTKPSSENYKSLDKKFSREISRKELRRVEAFQTELLDSLLENRELDQEQLRNEDLFKTNIHGQNFIHRVINDYSSEEMRFSPQALDVIQMLVLRDPNLFTAEDSRGETPIVEAAKHQMPALSHVISLLLPTSLLNSTKLHRRCEENEGICPLWQVSEALLEHCHKKADFETNGFVVKKNQRDTSNYCLHKVIDIEKLMDYDNNLRQSLRRALNSPKSAFACLYAILHDGNFDKDFKVDYIEWVKTFKVLLELCPDSVFGYAPYEMFTPLQTALRLYLKPQIHYDMVFEFVQMLVDRAPWSIFIESGPSDDPQAPLPKNGLSSAEGY